MTAQIANGGYKIYPKILVDNNVQQEDKFAPYLKIQEILK